VRAADEVRYPRLPSFVNKKYKHNTELQMMTFLQSRAKAKKAFDEGAGRSICVQMLFVPNAGNLHIHCRSQKAPSTMLALPIIWLYRERKYADTTGTVLVPSANHFQC